MSNGHLRSCRAFSLVELVVAIGIFSVAAAGIISLFALGLQSNKDSKADVKAANTAAMLIAVRKAAPTALLNNFALSTNALAQPYGPAFSSGSTSYISLEGQITNAAAAAYQLTCEAGTNAMTGSGHAQIYIMLTWPPQAAPGVLQTSRYEIITQIPNY